MWWRSMSFPLADLARRFAPSFSTERSDPPTHLPYFDLIRSAIHEHAQAHCYRESADYVASMKQYSWLQAVPVSLTADMHQPCNLLRVECGHGYDSNITQTTQTHMVVDIQSFVSTVALNLTTTSRVPSRAVPFQALRWHSRYAIDVEASCLFPSSLLPGEIAIDA